MKQQQGAALIISLIILAVLSVIGVASMQQSGLELKMISSARDRSVAFEAVETAIVRIEAQLTSAPPKLESHFSSCTGNQCFNEQCVGGLCFAGDFNNDVERAQCYVSDASDTQRKDFWQDETLNVWGDATKHQTISIKGLNTPVKYIVEFLCFTNVGRELGVGFSTQGASTKGSENENYKPLYRITAMANGNANRAVVVLQTTYRLSSNS
jgi:type IV pilus assembly protein PilX